MRSNRHGEPLVLIQESPDGRVSIRVEHYGRVPDLGAEFSADVLRRAVNKFRRTAREHRILVAARKLSPIARQVVEAHLIRERALRIELKLEGKARARPRSQSRAERQQQPEREGRVVEAAEYERQRDRKSAADRDAARRAMEVQRDERDGWFDALSQPRSSLQRETPTQRANRELKTARSAEPKVRPSDRKATQRAMEERDDSLHDRVEFRPERKPTPTQLARQKNGSKASRPRGDRTRSDDRGR